MEGPVRMQNWGHLIGGDFGPTTIEQSTIVIGMKDPNQVWKWWSSGGQALPMKSRFLIKEICAERKGSGESIKCLMRGVLTKVSEIVTLKIS